MGCKGHWLVGGAVGEVSRLQGVERCVWVESIGSREFRPGAFDRRGWSEKVSVTRIQLTS